MKLYENLTNFKTFNYLFLFIKKVTNLFAVSDERFVCLRPNESLICIAKIFNQHFANRAVICVQDPILLNDQSEPEPDLVLAQLPEVRYMLHHPKPEDIYVVFEVSDSTLSYDRKEYAPWMARNGVLQLCLLNIRGRELEDYREPAIDGYRTKTTYAETESFSLVAFPEIEIKVSDLLPPVLTNEESST